MNLKTFPVIFCALLQATGILSQQDESSIVKQVDGLLQEAVTNGLFSGAVAISHNGQRVFSKTVGFAHNQQQTPIGPNTAFNIGSLSKKFTQELIRQLAAEQKLSYDDPLDRYLDLFPGEPGKQITIRQLIDMTAGLGDFLQDPKYLNDLKQKDFTTADLLQVIQKEPLLFEPGKGNAYSNSGYAVLGAVIEKITGKPYRENLAERIFQPLGLKQILYTKKEIETHKDRAYGSEINLDGSITSLKGIERSTAAGGMYMDVNALLKFTEATLLHPASPLIRTRNAGSDERQGPPLFAGGSPGWSSAISFDEHNGYAIVVLSNQGDDIAVKLTRRINSIFRNEPSPPLQKPLKMTFYKIIQDNGYEYILKNAKTIASQLELRYDDHFLNDAGDEFLLSDEPKIAIHLFKINAELFPSSIHTLDVLARTLLKTGDRKEALKYLRQVLTLDPNNKEVLKLVDDLEKEK